MGTPEPDEEMISGLRRAYEAFSRGDFDTAMEIAHPEIEMVPPGGQSPLRGADAVRAWMEPDALEDQRSEVLEVRINGNRALIRSRNSARGAGSGIEVDVELWAVWTLDDEGLVKRIEGFLGHEKKRAFEAAGLSD